MATAPKSQLVPEVPEVPKPGFGTECQKCQPLKGRHLALAPVAAGSAKTISADHDGRRTQRNNNQTKTMKKHTPDKPKTETTTPEQQHRQPPPSYDIDRRVKLVSDYANKPLRRLVQFDDFGSEMFFGEKDELRGIDSVRLQVPAGTPKEVVLASLRVFESCLSSCGATVGSAPATREPLYVYKLIEQTRPLVLKLALERITKPRLESDSCPF